LNVYGICAVQNEGDVIADSVRWASRFCQHIWVWDLGSTDETWERLQSLNLPNVTAERREWVTFVNSIRGKLYAEVKQHVEEDSWVYILDPDEFHVGDPRPVLVSAANEGAGVVGVWQVNFLPTQEDAAALKSLGEEKWAAIPLAERLRHYRVEWFEHRFGRVVPGFQWDASGLFSRWLDRDGRPLPVSRRFGFVRHYRYRSPSQVARRRTTRKSREGVGDGLFRWTPSADFLDYARPSRGLCVWPPADPEVRVPWLEMQRARAVWTWWRAVHHVQRRLGLRSSSAAT
jgi:hypothetical protein